ncbi:MAG: hypothetical protein IPF92_21565 [Myxococcales bacterium]|nr:hypothetical protein [Myxococcales bacterium]
MSKIATEYVTAVPIGRPVWHTVRDAAEASGVSEAAIRRALARHGMRVGRTVAGYVEVRRAGAGFRGYVPVTSK